MGLTRGACIVVALLVACGGRAQVVTDGGSEAEVPSASCPAAAAPAGSCSALVVSGEPVVVGASSGTAPTPSGGTVEDGTYVLVGSTFYGESPPAEQDRITWLVCGSAWETAQETRLNGGAPQLLLLDATVTATGTSLGVDVTCGPRSSTTFGFDASPGMLRLYVTGYAPGLRVDTLVRM
jgi:hypothetical protein